ncbi:MAG: TMEM165/GDT1 family protein [Leptolyngbyaceae cyanobacterium bins.59]|nr:TMEM165/GDT1 family protein [Leptolyngbyaceae cyanobacterium bins.59]
MLSAFTAGLLLITVSELGDKTFFITAILSMRYSRRWVFVGSIAALATMTVLSVLLGQVASLLPREILHSASVILFIGFGLKLLYEGGREWLAKRQEPQSGKKACLELTESSCAEEVREAAELVQQAEKRLKERGKWAIVLEAFSLTFLAEWGDRTQFATIGIATTYNAVGVTIGAILGHAICAAIAVGCGRLIAGRISQEWLTMMGGLLFIVFGVVAWFEGV